MTKKQTIHQIMDTIEGLTNEAKKGHLIINFTISDDEEKVMEIECNPYDIDSDQFLNVIRVDGSAKIFRLESPNHDWYIENYGDQVSLWDNKNENIEYCFTLHE